MLVVKITDNIMTFNQLLVFYDVAYATYKGTDNFQVYDIKLPLVNTFLLKLNITQNQTCLFYEIDSSKNM